jgi:hypothetical protein
MCTHILCNTIDAFVNEAFMETLQDLGEKIESNLENSAVEGVR